MIIDLTDMSKGWKHIQQHLPEIFALYDQDVTAVTARLALTHKTIGTAQQEQCAWPIFYDERRAELGKLLKFIELQRDACRGRLYQKYTENYSRDLGDRARDKYIDGEPEYLAYSQLYLEAEELYNKYNAICNAWERRGFTLRDYTQLLINSLQDSQIR